MKATRIMYIENKENSLNGDAVIGRVTFSKTGRTVYYKGRRFRKIYRGGFKSNFFDEETGEEYWISGCKKNGVDRLYGRDSIPVYIDEDVREEYWTTIRNMPEEKNRKNANWG